jgi:hypothetical protein
VPTRSTAGGSRTRRTSTAVGPGHDDGRGAMAAADVGDPRPRLEPGLDAIQGRDPRLDQVGPVAGGEEHLAAVKDLGVLLVPADPGAGAEGLGDTRLGPEAGQGELERAGQVHRAGRVGQREGLLLGEAEPPTGRVVGQVAGGGLSGQPLVHVPLGGAGPLGQLGRAERTGTGHGPVQAEAVAENDHAGLHGRPQVLDELAQKGVEPVLVDGHDDSFPSGGPLPPKEAIVGGGRPVPHRRTTRIWAPAAS